MTAEEKAEHDRRSYDAEIAQLKKELANTKEELKEEIKELQGDIKDLVEAWNAAKGLTTFIKWLASIAAAVVMLWNLYFQHGAGK